MRRFVRQMLLFWLCWPLTQALAEPWRLIDGTRDGTGAPDAPFYHRDFPLSNGNCVHCHVPVLGLAVPRDADPAAAEGVAAEGVGCDFCHKIAGVAPDPKQGRIGAHAAVL